MPRFRLSRRADADLKAILGYSAVQFGRRQAVAYKESLEHTFALLADNPQLGRRSDFVLPLLRRHEHASHTIFYRREADHIFIVRVLPAQADWQAHLAEADTN